MYGDIDLICHNIDLPNLQWPLTFIKTNVIPNQFFTHTTCTGLGDCRLR